MGRGGVYMQLYVCAAVFELLMAEACQSHQRDAQIKQRTVHTGVVRLLTGSLLTSLFNDTEALCFLVVPQVASLLTSLLEVYGMTNKSGFARRCCLCDCLAVLCVKQQQCLFFFVCRAFKDVVH